MATRSNRRKKTRRDASKRDAEDTAWRGDETARENGLQHGATRGYKGYKGKRPQSRHGSYHSQ
eukprot:720049-Pelagomonas_calceolata.AAC.1